MANLLRDREVLARGEAAAYVENPPSAEDLRKLVTYIRESWQRRYGRVHDRKVVEHG